MYIEYSKYFGYLANISFFFFFAGNNPVNFKNSLTYVIKTQKKKNENKIIKITFAHRFGEIYKLRKTTNSKHYNLLYSIKYLQISAMRRKKNTFRK